MKNFKLLNFFLVFAIIAGLFSNKVSADAIVITTQRPHNFGHTSIISQDENGKWFYFFWGIKSAYKKEVPAEDIKNINTFNNWLYDVRRNKGEMKNSCGFYAHGIYIKGDFTQTTKYYSDKIKNYKIWKYFLGLNFCSVVSRRALEKGILPDGTSFKSHMKYTKADYIPFYDDFPHHYRRLIERSFKGTEYEAHSNWGKVTDEKIIDMINGNKK